MAAKSKEHFYSFDWITLTHGWLIDQGKFLWKTNAKLFKSWLRNIPLLCHFCMGTCFLSYYFWAIRALLHENSLQIPLLLFVFYTLPVAFIYEMMRVVFIVFEKLLLQRSYEKFFVSKSLLTVSSQETSNEDVNLSGEYFGLKKWFAKRRL